MTAFMLACAGLVLLSGLFYLFPRGNPAAESDDTSKANLEWYRLRREELLRDGGEELQHDAELRLLEDDAQAGAAVAVSDPGQSFPSWLLLPVVAVVAAALYYKLGAAPDVLISKQLETIAESRSPEQMQTLLQAIEIRSAQRPDNLHYTGLLGQFYMGQEDYKRAAKLYGSLAQEAPGDSQALAYAAQAEYLAGGRQLSERAQMYAEQSLAIDPHQRTALGLLGMASFEQGQFRAAIQYWERLLAMEPEGSESAGMIAGVIERARAKLGTEGDAIASSQAESPENFTAANSAVTSGVTVSIRFPDGADFRADDTVFVLARGANSDSRMPVAVQRLAAGQLPMTIRLDDSKSMAGQKLSTMESIVVVVQVSPEGRPGEASASWLGRAGPLKPSLDTKPLDIELSAK